MVSASRLVTFTSKSHAVRPSYMMYWMAMSGSNEPVCGSAVSLAEPPTMPTMRSPPLVGRAGREAELDASVVVSSLPHAAAIGPMAAAAPMAAAPLSRLRRENALAVDELADLSSNPDGFRWSLSVTIPVPLSRSFPEGRASMSLPLASLEVSVDVAVCPWSVVRDGEPPAALTRPAHPVTPVTIHPGG